MASLSYVDQIPSPDTKALSPLKSGRERSSSRPSSRNSHRVSVRAPSPSNFSLDDPVAVRNQVSTLKHTIRHQQAQLHNLENILLQGPRPYNPLADDEMDSSIREGVPMSFGVGSLPASHKRNSSPTRTLSRIPVSAVGNARALADEGNSRLAPIDVEAASNAAPGAAQSTSPNRRASFTPQGTTKVLADLQAGVVNARTALENTKSQLRLSQRTVAQLTRQTEDLKEGRDRLRLENEGLNNVVARKERLLQEVLERARKAEGEAASFKSQLKTETTTSKKAIREMESALSESTALSQRSEREYVTLRDSVKSMTDSWKDDLESIRAEMRGREDRLRVEAENLGKKYRELVEQIRTPDRISDSDRENIRKLREKDEKIFRQLEQTWLDEIAQLREDVQVKSKEGDEAAATAKDLSRELARLRRLMQRTDQESDNPPPS